MTQIETTPETTGADGEHVPYCTESDCRTPATWRYMLQPDQPRACCVRHEGQVRQRLEALGRIGVLCPNPIELIPCVAPTPPPRNLLAELGAIETELTDARRTIIQLGHELREATGEVGMRDRQLQHVLRELEAERVETSRLRRELNDQLAAMAQTK